MGSAGRSPPTSRLGSKVATDAGPPFPYENDFRVVDSLDVVVLEADKTVPQVALNWLLRRPSHHRGAGPGATPREPGGRRVGPGPGQVARLDAADAATPAYPYWLQRGFAERNPPRV